MEQKTKIITDHIQLTIKLQCNIDKDNQQKKQKELNPQQQVKNLIDNIKILKEQTDKLMTNTLQINQHIWIDQTKLLGKGSTGNVYLGGSYRDLSIKFAVKAIDLSEVNNEVTQYLLSCEIVALSELAKLNVEHVVKLHEIAFQEGFCYLCMELLEGGSLAEYIRENPNGLNEQQVQQLFQQLFQGYKSIRNLGIVHRDIKPDNIIFRNKPSSSLHQGQQKTLCYIDFGYCIKQSVPNRPQVYYNVGSPKYMAPEAYKKNSYSQKSDLWALGVILYEMLHGTTIDKNMEMDEYMRFMEQSEIPFANGVGVFMRRLVGGLLEVDVARRVGFGEVEQMIKGNYENRQNVGHNNNQQVNPGNHHQQQQQFFQFVSQLNIQQQSNNKRNSPFYRSQIITHRSDPSQTIHNFHSPHHLLNPPFDSRQQQRNFSQQNELHEFGHSPKKIIHLEHSSHKVRGMVANVVPFEGDKRQLVEKFRQFEQRNQSKQFFGGIEPVRWQLEKIEEEYDNDSSRHNLVRINSTVQNFRVQPDMKRSFLKAMDQGQQFQPKNHHQQNPQQITNPNVRFLSHNTFSINPSTPSRHQQLVRSQIFHFSPDKRLTSGNNFFSSQINQNPQGNNIKMVNSDKTINNRGLEQQKVEVLGRNLNKSYSTNNVMEKVEVRGDNRQDVVQPRFLSMNFGTNIGSQPMREFNNQGMRPIDLLMQNKEIANKRAFLRNTMPNVYRSSIEPIHFTVNQQPNNHHQNLDISKDLRKKETPVIQQVNHSNFKKHGQYFDQNFVTPQKQTNLQNNLTATQFKTAYPFTAIHNRNQKSHSFKVIQNDHRHSMQRDRTMINILNQSPNPMNQQLQFNHQQIIDMNQQQLQQQAPINIMRQQLIQKPIQQQQVHGQSVQINQQGQQLVTMGQVQGKNMFYGNGEQQQRNIVQQNIQPPQTTFQMINLHQPTRSNDNQFRRSTIINLSQHNNQQPIQVNQHRNFIQNKNSSYQQPRQSLIIDKPFFSQVSQPQRQILVNTINHNTQVNRMIRQTYPLGSQQSITATQF